jgi:hypothetical protein
VSQQAATAGTPPAEEFFPAGKSVLAPLVLSVLPLVALGGVVLIQFLLYREYVQSFPHGAFGESLGQALPIARGALTNDRLIHAVAGRQLWVAMAVLFVVAMLGALIAGAYVISAVLQEKGRKYQILATAGAFIVAVVPKLITGRLGSYQTTTEVLDATVGALMVRDFTGVMIHLDKIGFSVGFFLAIASCMTIWPQKMFVNQAPARLATRMGFLRTLLYTGTIVLVTTILLWSAALSWASELCTAVAADKEAVAAFKHLSTQMILGRGLYFTLLLAGVYLSSAVIHRFYAERLAAQETGNKVVAPAERLKWLQERELVIPITEGLPRLAAIVSPLLTGSIAELLKLI